LACEYTDARYRVNSLAANVKCPLVTGSDRNPVYERLPENRIVVLGREIDDDVCQPDVYTIASSDTVQFIGCAVPTCAVGTAASTGQFLLIWGTPGKRSALPHASTPRHQPHAGIAAPRQTSASDIRVRPGSSNGSSDGSPR
ncbi:MAG: ATP-dependent Clp protease, protease subunit, partial [Pseudonocardiales bacterium]|nr:ATP-dependent Clp protease, protease subunit [Pseudonocardiales bacterium]